MDDKAKELIEKAEANLTKVGCFGLNSKKEKWETSAELYNKAANIYKLTKEWCKASNAFTQAAQLFLQIDDTFSALDNYILSSNCLKKFDPIEAIETLNIIYNLYLEKNSYTNAAKYMKEIATIYEQQQNYIEAKKAYQKAAEIYEIDDKTTLENECLVKIADLNIELDQFNDASRYYQKVAEEYIKSPLLKFKCKEFLFKAGLCQLCNDDLIENQRQLNRYCDIDHTFSTSREYKLLSHIISSIEASDLELFTNSIIEYDNISPLTHYLTKVLLQIQTLITDEQSLA